MKIFPMLYKLIPLSVIMISDSHKLCLQIGCAGIQILAQILQAGIVIPKL